MKNTLVIIYMFLFYIISFGQTADLRFVEVLNDGTNYDVKLQIEGNPSFNLGSSNLKFNFNNADLANPVLLTSHNFNNPPIYYEIIVTEPKLGIASANIELGFQGFGTEVATTWTDVATIRFTILNSAGSSQLTWRDMNPPEIDNPTVIFLDNEENQITKGVFNELDTSPLPVELTSFSVNSVEDTKAQLEWETATEVNNYGFEIERASTPLDMTNSLKWKKVAFIEGHGNSNSPKTYSYIDKNLIGGNKFAYRLKQIDIDGTFEYSDEIEVEVLLTQYKLYQNYPNPFNPTAVIRYGLPKESNVKVIIYNIRGEIVNILVNKTQESGYYEVNFDASNLASGIYIYSIQSKAVDGTKEFRSVKKMILLR